MFTRATSPVGTVVNVAEVVLITGLSGAGRSGAADALEDLGWYVVDNLPTELVDTIVDLVDQPGGDIDRLALVAGRQHQRLADKIADLRASEHDVTVLFLDATTPTLVARYDATRRRHPMELEAPGVEQAIELERGQLESARAAADLIIDTTDLNIHELSDRIGASIGATSKGQLRVAITSFGFKHGSPRDADIVMDVRFLPNPHWEPELRPQTGLDEAVREFVIAHGPGADFIDRFGSLLTDLLPSYASGGRSYLTVAIGCTGGRHRSVAVAEALAERVREHGTAVGTRHRDLGR